MSSVLARHHIPSIIKRSPAHFSLAGVCICYLTTNNSYLFFVLIVFMLHLSFLYCNSFLLNISDVNQAFFVKSVMSYSVIFFKLLHSWQPFHLEFVIPTGYWYTGLLQYQNFRYCNTGSAVLFGDVHLTLLLMATQHELLQQVRQAISHRRRNGTNGWGRGLVFYGASSAKAIRARILQKNHSV